MDTVFGSVPSTFQSTTGRCGTVVACDIVKFEVALYIHDTLDQ